MLVAFSYLSMFWSLAHAGRPRDGEQSNGCVMKGFPENRTTTVARWSRHAKCCGWHQPRMWRRASSNGECRLYLAGASAWPQCAAATASQKRQALCHLSSIAVSKVKRKTCEVVLVTCNLVGCVQECSCKNSVRFGMDVSIVHVQGRLYR